MKQAVLEPRPLYGIGTVARLTGLKPDTLRVWERRYGLGASHKSKTGRRQYTQSDLEHLQLVSALVASGSRIGEIAGSERKTLEMLLRGRGQGDAADIPEPKPAVVFVGEGLCNWLDEHQGCLANVDAKLARFSLSEALGDQLPEIDRVDCLVVECANMASAQLASLLQLRQKLQASKVLVTYRSCNDGWLRELDEQGILGLEFPPDPAYLAFELGQCVAEKVTRQGNADLGDLVAGKPRQFNEFELSAARSLKSSLDCECPRHISELIEALARFEAYSASCSVENWHDAAVHACIFAYTGQARWLMEKALAAVLEERTSEFAEEVQRQKQSELAT